MAGADHGEAAAELFADVVRALAADAGAGAGPAYVGFSGGLDSTVLLHAAARARPRGPLVALHVNHGLQAGADAWQRHCERVAAGLGVEFVARRVQVVRRGGIEAAARAARYAVFAEFLAVPGSRLLLAHHRDDQAETGLLRLLQGRGLYGMPAERRLGAGRVLRPLLRYPRALLEAHARATGLEWLDDPANADLGPDRNFVRHRVLPQLRTRFPAVESALLTAMAEREAEDALLRDALGIVPLADSLPVAAFLARTEAERLILLRLWLAAHGRATPAGRALREFTDQLAAPPDRQPRLEIDRGELRRHAGRVWICEPPPDLAAAYALPMPGCLALPHGYLTVLPDPAGFAGHGPGTVRFRAGGEWIRSAGRQRRVKQLLHAAGVAPWLRATYPLVFDDLGLAAVPGIAARDGDATSAAPRFRAEWHPGQASTV